MPGVNGGLLATLQTKIRMGKLSSQPAWGQRASWPVPGRRDAEPQYDQKVNNKLGPYSVQAAGRSQALGKDLVLEISVVRVIDISIEAMIP